MTVTRYSPFPEEVGAPDEWPFEYVSSSDYDALAARLAEAIWVLKAIREDEMHAGGLGDDVQDAWERLCTPDSAAAPTSAAAPREV